MQRAWRRKIGQYAGGAVALLALAATAGAGDDGQNPGLFGRLFRGGNGGSNSPATTPKLPYGGSSYNSSPIGGGSSMSSHSSFGDPLGPSGPSTGPVTPAPIASSENPGLPETPRDISGGQMERLTPRSRVSQAVTTADPVLTRFALGRSNDGTSFGMFLQVFADGTVVDSEGVHRVRPADLRPIFESVQSGELYRLRGHCGAPSTDFIEYVHVVAYERRLGRLQAHSFSYSGNPQGCDHAIRHLHTAIENLQAKLSRPAATSPGMDAPGPVTPAPTAPVPTAPIGPAIPLSSPSE